MSKFNAFKMINWMYFQNETIKTKGFTALFGVNGSGKSTVIDAMQMLLLGNGASKFNSNANAEKRTLESYVRGAVSLEGKEFLRPNDVITYLALEIDINNHKHIIGINIEYNYIKGELSDPRYFYINNEIIADSLFIRNNLPKTYHEFLQDLKNNDIEYKNFPTLIAYQNKVKDLFGLKDEKKYFKTLRRAVGLKNIKDCNKFMNDFVLDEAIIDLEDLKKNISKIEKLNKEIEVSEVKLHDLEDVASLGDALRNKKEEDEIYQAAIVLANYLSIKKTIEDANENIDSLNRELFDFNNIVQNKETEIYRIKDQKADYTRSLDSIAPDLRNKRELLASKRKEYDDVKTYHNTLINRLEDAIFNIKDYSKINKKAIDIVEYIKNGSYDTASIKKKFYEFKNILKDDNDDHILNKAEINMSIENIKRKHDKLKDQINSLKNNTPKYDDNLVEFKNYIQNGLREKFQEDVEVGFLADYLDINNNEWRNAIEGYLNTQRFYLVIAPKYYNEALKLYSKKKDFDKTNIIDSTKLGSFDIEPNTLSEFIESSNSIALNYARFILNRVHYVDNVEDLNKYHIAVTRDCMRYQNYSVGRLNIKSYRIQYIGQEGIRISLERLQMDEAKLIEEAHILRNAYLVNDKELNLIKDNYILTSNLIENNNYFNSIDAECILFKEIEALEGDIKLYESNPNYIELQSRILKCDELIETLNTDIELLNKDIINIKSNIITITESITNNKARLELIEEDKNQYDDIVIERAKDKISNKKLTPIYIRQLEKEKAIINSDKIKTETNLAYLMKDCNFKYSFSYIPSYDSLDRYKEERNKINKTVFDFKKTLVEFQETTKKIFFTTFLSKLYNLVEGAQKEINNLNYSLRVFDFGEINYEIRYGITQNKDLAEIYRFAKEYNDDDINRPSIFTGMNFDADREKIRALVNSYIFSENPQNREMIVDYRKYMDFDILIHTPSGTKSFKKVNMVQSGGEVQVPFYILSAVAFQQTLDYKRNKDAFCIMLFDEAFDKMDSQRIDQMLKFYRDKLNVQPVLAMPGKLDSVYNNVDTILTVVRESEIAEIKDFSHEI